ncbi:hypothetical protein MPL1_03935 [Methylophaga lonarensis MPL]|uniref:DUF2157 domain-containing protein n=1 Tax=Methylophaga lonarensis MPL TaxID=1286106 RepID=M7PID1_9GAMM|nr:hypothetical protein [Methylophaga lonarensis]EMR13655.1 hypothetical protein MPL1_03935 [Methylophaga lonarensis MPL]
MKITKNQLDSAVAQEILSQEQATRLFDFLKSHPATGPSFDFTHVLYYLGGLIAIGAMTLFMTLGWERFGGWGIFFISLLYAGVGLSLANHFQAKGLAIPAGICAAFVVALTPLAIYGLQQAIGFWPDSSVYQEYHRYIRWHWLYMQLGTLAVGAIMAYRYRYPFLLMPIAVTLWYLSMDIAAILVGGWASFELRALVSMYFGLTVMLLGFWIDMRSHRSGDYAFWLYLFGVIAFWGGLSAQYSDSELAKFTYFCINLLLIGIGVLIVRRVFVVFGALGTTFYLGHLANVVFKDSLMFPIALTAIGLGLIYLGILWQKHELQVSDKIHQLLPTAFSDFLKSKRS